MTKKTFLVTLFPFFPAPVVEDDSGNTSGISDDEAPTSRHTEFSTDAEHNLTCCILMLDILLKQVGNFFFNCGSEINFFISLDGATGYRATSGHNNERL